jgi:capsular exopolysaccharide synthesis family protein
MELIQFANVLWRRRAVVVGSLLCFLVVATLATILLPRSYEAETELLVTGEESTTSLLNELGLSEMAMSLNGDDHQNKIYLATSDPIMEDVIWRLQLRDSDGHLYEAEDISEGGSLSIALGTPGVEVTQISGTDVLTITATAPSPEAARLMANTIADSYIRHTTEQERTEIREAQRFIQAQLELVNQELDSAFSQIAVAQQQDEIIDLESEVRAAVGRLSELLLEKETASAKAQEIRARITSTKEFRALESTNGVSSTTMTTNPVIGSLRTRITEIRARKEALLLDNHTTLSPEVRELEFQITAANDELSAAMNEMSTLDPIVANLEAELSGVKERSAEIANSIQRTTSAFANYPDKMRRISQLELAANAAEAVYRSLQDQRFQIGIAEAMTMSDVRIVATAKLPEKHSSPLALLNGLLGLILGMCFGTASAFVLEYVDDSLKEANLAREVWDLPQLGLIPRHKARNGAALSGLSPTDPLAESYRTIRNSIHFASLDKPAKFIAVTSSIPGEGKSTMVANLAISMARDGKRVLIVDADLRRPTQHQFFNETLSAPGLVEVLSRHDEFADTVQRTPIDNLDMLSAGTAPADPGKLVESLRMRAVLGEIGRDYDVILVDTPPVLAVGDALIIGRMVDGVIIVAEIGVVTRRLLADTRDRAESAQVQPMGMVFNKVPGSPHPYAAYYQQRPPAPKKSQKGGAA